MNIEEAQVFLEKVLHPQRLSDVQHKVFHQCWEGRNYEEIAKQLGYQVEYIKQVGSKLWKLLSQALGEKVTKANLQSVFERYSHSVLFSSIKSGKHYTDWGDALDTSIFFGRREELATLREWIVNNHCRLVVLLGMGGIGKTALAARLAQEIQEEFEYLIWRSLRNAPPIDELLNELIMFLSQQQEIDLPNTTDGKMLRLMHYLRSHKCLLILDNLETILKCGDIHSPYLQGYERYGQLLRYLGETQHSSCLMLTSRESPFGLVEKEGKNLYIRSLYVKGLSVKEVQRIFQAKGDFKGSEVDWNALIKHYAGNPLALKIAAVGIQDHFDGDISKIIDFLKSDILLFNDISNLLERQFERLSEIEKDVMYWLTISRESVSIQELKENFTYFVTKSQLLEVCSSLLKKSLIEKQIKSFTQQPVIMEYLTEKFISKVLQEINNENIHYLDKFTLMKVTAKEYIKDSQIRLVLQPLIQRLCSSNLQKESIKNKINQILTKIHEQIISNEKDSQKLSISGYAVGNLINILSYLKISLANYSFSNLTIKQADLRRVNLKNVNFQNAIFDKSVFAETLSSVTSVAVSPNGKLLATGDTLGHINVWQITNSQESEEIRLIASLKGHKGWVWTVAFSLDSCTLASGSNDSTIRIWDMYNFCCIKVLQGHSNGVLAVSFSPDSTTLASGSNDSHILLWNINEGKYIKVLNEHKGAVWAVNFSPDGRTLVSGSVDHSIRLWEISSGNCYKILNGHTDVVCSVTFSSDGRQLVSGSHDTSVRLWDVNQGICVKVLCGHTQGVNSVSFSPDNHTVASGGCDSKILLWDVKAGTCIKTLYGHTDWIWSVTFGSNGTILASGSRDQTVRLWDANHGRCIRILHGQVSGGVWTVSCSPITSPAINQNGSILAIGSFDSFVRLWNPTKESFSKVLQGHSKGICSVKFNSTGTTLASSSRDHTIRLWDVHQGVCTKVLQGHTDGVWTISFNPNDRTMASGSNDHSIRLWDLETGCCLNTLHGHNDWVRSVSFSPNGQVLASASHDGSILLWDVLKSNVITALRGHKSWVSSVSFSSDGKILASSSHDFSIRLWNLENGKCIQVLHGHTGAVWTVVCSVDSRLASGSEDFSIRLWDIHTGSCLNVLWGHTSCVYSVDFSPDGKTLVSGSQDGTIKIWDISTGTCFKTLQVERLYENMDITNVAGLTEAQKNTLKFLGAIERCK